MFDAARDRSVVVGVVSGAADRIRTAIGGSVFVQSVGGWVSRLRSRNEGESGEGRFRRARENSRAISVIGGSTLVSSGATLGSRVRQWWGDSRLVGVGNSSREVVESSFAYRWLTSEPDPEVIVIDLRETRALGPVIRGVDRGVSEFAARSRTSTVVGTLGWVSSAVRARPIRVVSAVVLSAVVASLLLVATIGSVSEPLLLGQLLVAGLAALGLRSRSSLEELLESRVGRALVAAFEPPEPPDRVDNESQQDEEDARQTPGNRTK